MTGVGVGWAAEWRTAIFAWHARWCTPERMRVLRVVWPVCFGVGGVALLVAYWP